MDTQQIPQYIQGQEEQEPHLLIQRTVLLTTVEGPQQEDQPMHHTALLHMPWEVLQEEPQDTIQELGSRV